MPPLPALQRFCDPYHVVWCMYEMQQLITACDLQLDKPSRVNGRMVISAGEFSIAFSLTFKLSALFILATMWEKFSLEHRTSVMTWGAKSNDAVQRFAYKRFAGCVQRSLAEKGGSPGWLSHTHSWLPRSGNYFSFMAVCGGKMANIWLWEQNSLLPSICLRHSPQAYHPVMAPLLQ